MKIPLILKITNASFEHDMVLKLDFNNGESRLCDFMPLSEKGVCRKLRDKDYFMSFTLDPYTVDWNNEIGFAPEFLYEHSIREYPTVEDMNDGGMAAEGLRCAQS